MNLIDLLYGNNHDSAKGKMHLRNSSGGLVTVTKEIYYSITDGNTRIHVTGYDDLADYCRMAGVTYRSGKSI